MSTFIPDQNRLCVSKIFLFFVSMFFVGVVSGQKIENKLIFQDNFLLNRWWSLHGDVMSHIGYCDVKWQSIGARGALGFRANGWISLEVGGLFAYVYHDRTFRETELRFHQSVYVRAPGDKRLKTRHEIRYEQRMINYRPIDVEANSSRVVYRMEPRFFLSPNVVTVHKGVWFVDGLVSLSFNMKSELPENDFFQRAAIGGGIGYALTDFLETRLLYSRQFGTTKPYYYGEEDGLNSIELSLRHTIKYFD